jgi:hypothetical protein
MRGRKRCVSAAIIVLLLSGCMKIAAPVATSPSLTDEQAGPPSPEGPRPEPIEPLGCDHTRPALRNQGFVRISPFSGGAPGNAARIAQALDEKVANFTTRSWEAQLAGSYTDVAHTVNLTIAFYASEGRSEVLAPRDWWDAAPGVAARVNATLERLFGAYSPTWNRTTRGFETTIHVEQNYGPAAFFSHDIAILHVGVVGRAASGTIRVSSSDALNVTKTFLACGSSNAQSPATAVLREWNGAVAWEVTRPNGNCPPTIVRVDAYSASILDFVPGLCI